MVAKKTKSRTPRIHKTPNGTKYIYFKGKKVKIDPKLTLAQVLRALKRLNPKKGKPKKKQYSKPHKHTAQRHAKASKGATLMETQLIKQLNDLTAELNRARGTKETSKATKDLTAVRKDILELKKDLRKGTLLIEDKKDSSSGLPRPALKKLAGANKKKLPAGHPLRIFKPSGKKYGEHPDGGPSDASLIEFIKESSLVIDPPEEKKGPTISEKEATPRPPKRKKTTPPTAGDATDPEFSEDYATDTAEDDDDIYEDDDMEGFGQKPGEGLSTSEIDALMKSPYYIATLPADGLHRVLRHVDPTTKKFGFIFNNKKSNHSGEHWLACFVRNDDSINFYDSFAQEPPRFFMKWVNDLIRVLQPDVYMKLKVNRIVEQRANSDNCGWFCMRFLHKMFSGEPFINATAQMGQVLKNEDEIEDYKTKIASIYPKFKLV